VALQCVDDLVVKCVSIAVVVDCVLPFHRNGNSAVWL